MAHITGRLDFDYNNGCCLASQSQNASEGGGLVVQSLMMLEGLRQCLRFAQRRFKIHASWLRDRVWHRQIL